MPNNFIYSVFSGTIYQVPEKDIKILDIGQIALLKQPPNNCKKCYGRGYSGRDSDNFAYYGCTCIRKIVDNRYTNILAQK